MTTSKQVKLSITLKSVELIKELSLGLAPIGCIATRHFCNEISRTLINQAGEIAALTAKNQNLATASNSYEVHWDSLIFAIMGADGTADIINAADAERMTVTAIAAVKKLASERDEKQRIAEAFQKESHISHPQRVAPSEIVETIPDITSANYWFDGTFQPMKYYRDVERAFIHALLNIDKGAE